uniref:Uncharacterized protein n=1 Tax=Anguilla anguilla TaxID=7936 RepID=A0A0E9S032_ANGAN
MIGLLLFITSELPALSTRSPFGPRDAGCVETSNCRQLSVRPSVCAHQARRRPSGPGSHATNSLSSLPLSILLIVIFWLKLGNG